MFAVIFTARSAPKFIVWLVMKNYSQKCRLPVAAAALVLLLSGCVNTPEVRIASDPYANFSGYQTFGFVSPLGTDRSGYQTLITQQIKSAVQGQLEARGMRLTADAPQLLVNFNAFITDKTHISTAPILVQPAFGSGFYGGSYYGYRGGLYSPWPMYVDQTVVSSYKEGTLNIDIIDASRKQLIWEGRVIDDDVTCKERANLQTSINAAVAAAFAKYPVQPKAK